MAETLINNLISIVLLHYLLKTCIIECNLNWHIFILFQENRFEFSLILLWNYHQLPTVLLAQAWFLLSGNFYVHKALVVFIYAVRELWNCIIDILLNKKYVQQHLGIYVVSSDYMWIDWQCKTIVIQSVASLHYSADATGRMNQQSDWYCRQTFQKLS